MTGAALRPAQGTDPPSDRRRPRHAVKGPLRRFAPLTPCRPRGGSAIGSTPNLWPRETRCPPVQFAPCTGSRSRPHRSAAAGVRGRARPRPHPGTEGPPVCTISQTGGPPTNGCTLSDLEEDPGVRPSPPRGPRCHRHPTDRARRAAVVAPRHAGAGACLRRSARPSRPWRLTVKGGRRPSRSDAVRRP